VRNQITIPLTIIKLYVIRQKPKSLINQTACVGRGQGSSCCSGLITFRRSCFTHYKASQHRRASYSGTNTFNHSKICFHIFKHHTT